ncbi:glycogen/starch/alpha-glucan phosphorylase [Macrococcus armenti]|uniref:glycogen/starch/alpha-glucan phosphorylase n=1 Tax=Macrococcus armenti TaxID=2875764 RepID=UPI001CCA1406|nr:glycogen/starch/alpha-glucan phosphorylase [Macrococcus armenti]UBH09478.1 glycogen/starch/alpha-glucan phosphorylase [Macrococcus armenti]UBH11769.1 glycogen/starch/alpha-glucan phosphorylase [Macrococcus armenti]
MKTYTKSEFRKKLEMKLTNKRTATLEASTNNDLFYAICSILKDEINQAGLETKQNNIKQKRRQINYISMEFLIGRLIESNLLNAGLLDVCNEVLIELGKDPKAVYSEENDAGLGNGGLGRLAACFLDSIASLGYMGSGFGIRYRYGLFEQRIVDGNQIELPDNWLQEVYPWETRRIEEAVHVHFGGEVTAEQLADGNLKFNYKNQETVLAVPYDVGVVGYDNDVVNQLRLWSAELPNDTVEAGYSNRLEHMQSVERISGFLYPDDSTEEGRFLRLKQQYFLVSSTIQTLIKQYKEFYQLPITEFHKYHCIQINDTHPTFGIPELMRILMDEEGLGWDAAWKIVSKTFAYTNHTIMQEALEKWPVSQVNRVNPRIFMIINEINERFCKEVYEKHPDLRDKISDLAVISHDVVHMSKLAIVGSFSVNGVAALHSQIIKEHTFNDFYKITPKKFNNKTNGITHRRWLMTSNPKLTHLINDAIGDNWIKYPGELTQLMRYYNDTSFLDQLAEVKLHNKQVLQEVIYKQTGIEVDATSVFDVQVKRLHEYKRQLLNLLHIIYLYNEIKRKPSIKIQPRTFIFGAKAAPGYHIAKEVIKLIHAVANVVNHDSDVADRIKVVFLENYNVTLAEDIMPAAEISEQISTASMEASGTGNMKMMMNGAITLGTMDGANVEIAELVGKENIFIFGLSSEEVIQYQLNGGYRAEDVYKTDVRVKSAMDSLINEQFGHDYAFNDLYYHILTNNDPYFILKDFNAYVDIHLTAMATYQDKKKWNQMSLMNIMKSGQFSSDRTIKEYATDIWKLK